LSSRPEQEEPPVGPIKVERVGAFSWWPFAIVAAILAVLGLALWKPWQTNPSRPVLVAKVVATAAPVSVATPTAAPTVDPVIEDASGRMLCNAPPDWRLVTMETDVLGDSRTMYGAQPATASGPSDSRIPTVELHANAMFGLGVCRPNPAGLRVPDLPFNPLTIWQTHASGGAPTQVVDPYVIDQALFRLGEVYLGPPHTSTGPPYSGVVPTWPAGRYVVEISSANSQDQALWIAVDFISIQASAGALGQ
jgi:hypothetical protein